MAEKKNVLDALRESRPAQAIDKAISAIDKFLGPSAKAQLLNGLDELRQVFVPGVQQIQPGNNPGLWGTITTGEATAERMADKEEFEKSYEVPQKKQERGLEM